jgi:hypothetical protein
MYSFYEVSVFKVTAQERAIWAVVTLEGGNSVIVWMMDLEEDALDVKEIRLSEGADRMTRYGGGQTVSETTCSLSPSISEVMQYAADNGFVWEIDLQHSVFESWSRSRLTRARMPDDAPDSQT